MHLKLFLLYKQSLPSLIVRFFVESLYRGDSAITKDKKKREICLGDSDITVIGGFYYHKNKKVQKFGTMDCGVKRGDFLSLKLLKPFL